MGKWTDKDYITHSEWTRDFSGAKGGDKNANVPYKRLPLNCCSLSLVAFEHPVCTADGQLFDLENIVQFIGKHACNPVDGSKLDIKSLIKLNFDKNEKGEFHCPITMKVFNEHSHVVAIKVSGNVFSYEAIEQLNIKAKNWRDLLTDETFTRSDIITLQDPNNHLHNRDISKFHHVKNHLKWREDKDSTNTASDQRIRSMTRAVMKQVDEKKTIPRPSEFLPSHMVSTGSVSSTSTSGDKPYNAAVYSQNKMSASLTSTIAPTFTRNESALINENEYMYSRMKKKGYARIHTNLGDINIELHCDITPKTCHNFVQLAKSNYYQNTIFHRSIRHFMIQGGDPTGKGTGGESFWKKPFEDEFRQNLSHSQRGILSMANHGPNSNGSQFFMTFKSCPHLDRKHTVFGKIVGGLETLDKMEAIPTDDQDRPIKNIVIKDITVFVDPFDEYLKELKEKLESKNEKLSEKNSSLLKENSSKKHGDLNEEAKATTVSSSSSGIGKYMKQNQSTEDAKRRKL